MQHYIAAGFDPARFWNITPRLMMLEMEGAAKRMARERELVWWGAMLPHLEKPVPLDVFVGRPVDPAERARRLNEAWDKIDRALARGKTPIVERR